jgi:Domain of unknown function (DUF6249)
MEPQIPQQGGTEYVVIAGLAGVIVLLAIGFRAWLDFRLERERYQTLRTFLERGVALPEALLQSGGRSDRDELRRALTAICIGLTMTGVFAVTPSFRGAFSFGLLPVAVGVAQLLSWLFTRKR